MPTTAAGVFKAVQDLAPQADARSGEISELRRLPDDLGEALIDTGVFRLWVAAEYGGIQATALDLYRAVEHAAYFEGSFAWVMMICGATSRLSGQLPHEHAQALFGSDRSVVAGFIGANGTATVVDGGLSVTGRWPWGSGGPLCTAIGGGARIVDSEGQPATLSDGATAPFVLLERPQFELADNWDTVGLRGSASGDYSCANAFVPNGRWLINLAAPGVIDDPLYRFAPTGSLAAGVASVAVGLARRAID